MRRARRPTNAFSLVEVLVALALFAGGLLALSASAVSSMRLESMAARRALAASLVLGRVEQLRAAGCDAADGTDSAGGVAAHWHIDRGPHVAQFRDSVVIRDARAGGQHLERVRGAVPC